MKSARAAPSRATPSPAMDPDSWRDMDRVFALEGEPMRVHRNGRGVWRLDLSDGTYYLKRFWFRFRYPMKSRLSRGNHELRMIDWLNANGFAGPEVAARREERRWGWGTRLFFLMREVSGEVPVSQAWLDRKDERPALLAACAAYVARLHQRGFHHHDLMTKHLFAASGPKGWSFRNIDVERATVGAPNPKKAARDLLTLACSVHFEPLRTELLTRFVDDYLAARPELDAAGFRALHERLSPNNNLKRELKDPILVEDEDPC
ncbi:MAG: hypothetical protein KC466_09115 [Myxococcales bacterium]|nr:hypothetical protein [Myxococcales bacterium]